MKVTGFRSWNTNADNLEDMVKFYRDVLGAQVNLMHTVGDVEVARLGLGDTTIGIFDASAGPRPGVPHHTFNIEGPEDAQELARELESKGVKVEGIRPHGAEEGSGYSLYVNDPSGNRLELSREPG